MKNKIFALSMAAMSLPASAGILGQVINFGYEFGGSTSNDALLVGAGAEITCPAGPFNMCTFLTAATSQTVDADDTSITYLYKGSGAGFSIVAGFNGFDFNGLDAGGNVLGPVMLSTNIVGLDMSRIASTASSIRIDMESLGVVDGSFFVVSFGGAAIPEPGTFGLLGASLAALVWRFRQR
ncbi:MAG: PEP-CTERM sorting domain-containing protein [Bryobacteraceae bacterium]|nr:PEP-CTERM sorting domain-containing protein [Bryobacteraceae bacterium]